MDGVVLLTEGLQVVGYPKYHTKDGIVFEFGVQPNNLRCKKEHKEESHLIGDLKAEDGNHFPLNKKLMSDVSPRETGGFGRCSLLIQLGLEGFTNGGDFLFAKGVKDPLDYSAFSKVSKGD